MSLAHIIISQAQKWELRAADEKEGTAAPRGGTGRDANFFASVFRKCLVKTRDIDLVKFLTKLLHGDVVVRLVLLLFGILLAARIVLYNVPFVLYNMM